jgi:hypothetical protein
MEDTLSRRDYGGSDIGFFFHLLSFLTFDFGYSYWDCSLILHIFPVSGVRRVGCRVAWRHALSLSRVPVALSRVGRVTCAAFFRSGFRTVLLLVRLTVSRLVTSYRAVVVTPHLTVRARDSIYTNVYMFLDTRGPIPTSAHFPWVVSPHASPPRGAPRSRSRLYATSRRLSALAKPKATGRETESRREGPTVPSREPYRTSEGPRAGT